MTKTRKSADTPARPGARVLVLANTTVRVCSALAADGALAREAAVKASLPRQRLAELRALYTAQETMPDGGRVDANTLPASAASTHDLQMVAFLTFAGVDSSP